MTNESLFIKRIKAIRQFGRVLLLLNVGNYVPYHYENLPSSIFGLKDSKDYVERMVKKGIL